MSGNKVELTEMSTNDLRGVLFQEILDLRDGKSNPSRAIAVSKLATNIINTAVLDVKAAKMVQDSKRNGLGHSNITPLSLLTVEEDSEN